MSDSRCAEIRQYVGPYVDGEFDERDAALFEDHLAHCSECRAYFEEQTWMMSICLFSKVLYECRTERSRN